MGCSDSKTSNGSSGAKPSNKAASSSPAANGAAGKSGKLTLYLSPYSSPSRATYIAIKTAKIDAEIKWMDMFNGEHKQDWFLKLNPDHCVPTMVDGDFTLWESRAVMPYLIQKYAPGHSLYPSDLQKKADIDRFLHYDLGTFFPAFYSYLYPVAFQGATPDVEKEKKMIESLEYYNKHLEGRKYLSGDSLTIADISLANSFIQAGMIDYDFSPYPNVARLRDEVKGLEAAEYVMKEFAGLKEILAKKKQEQQPAPEEQSPAAEEQQV